MSSNPNIINAIQISSHVFTMIASLTLLGVSVYKVIRGDESQTYLSLITFLTGMFIPSPTALMSNITNKYKTPKTENEETEV